MRLGMQNLSYSVSATIQTEELSPFQPSKKEIFTDKLATGKDEFRISNMPTNLMRKQSGTHLLMM